MSAISFELHRGPAARPTYDNPSAHRLLMATDRVFALVAESVAAGLTRRGFLKRLGAGTLAVSVATLLPQRRAIGEFNNCESPCGPSKTCPASRCTNYYECKCEASGNKTELRGPWTTAPNNCMGCSGDNDWWENHCGSCQSPYRGFYECNDCCTLNLSSAYGTCSSCSVTKRKCICRAKHAC